MSEIPLHKKFAVLCEITRAQHFAWHAAVAELCPDVAVAAVTDRMWELTGKQTAAAYLKRLDKDAPLSPQIAEGIRWSSECMGEDASVEPSVAGRDEVFLRQHACPGHHGHKRVDLVSEDQPGCDRWFALTIDTINEALDTTVRFETLQSLPEGGDSCLRRIWMEQE